MLDWDLLIMNAGVSRIELLNYAIKHCVPLNEVDALISADDKPYMLGGTIHKIDYYIS